MGQSNASIQSDIDQLKMKYSNVSDAKERIMWQSRINSHNRREEGKKPSTAFIEI